MERAENTVSLLKTLHDDYLHDAFSENDCDHYHRMVTFLKSLNAYQAFTRSICE